MIQSRMIGDVLHIDNSEERLMGLTIYNGCGDVVIHYMTKDDADSIIKTLQNYKRFLKREGK